ncbi:LuxR C-terminal-related transcriptional regulator [Streptomyces sp. NPDC020192]|uniref:helix-turn-helix transcriptional regulator n=1 Tax=Streptomyces sp. NPDC020192 TaxID=3365066 RepID=UPI0037A79E72
MSADTFDEPVLDEYAIELYGWILDNRDADLCRAARDLGISRLQAATAFKRLVRLRVVRVDPEDAEVAWAVDPDAASVLRTRPLHETIRREQAQLDRLLHDFDLLRNRFLRARGGESRALQVIPSLEEVRAALNRAAAECREEMVTMQPGGNRQPEALEEAMARDHALLSRGVRMRTVYHHTSRFNGPSQVYVARAGALGTEYRTVHDLVGRMIIFDGHRLAFIPLRDDDNGAVAIREASVVAFLHQLFEHVWAHATPFHPAAPEHLEKVAKEIDQTIVRLLAAGLKDETIARRVGMSLRTTRRHIADIMRLLGAESRFQAGILVARAQEYWGLDDAAGLPEPSEHCLHDMVLRLPGG